MSWRSAAMLDSSRSDLDPANFTFSWDHAPLHLLRDDCPHSPPAPSDLVSAAVRPDQAAANAVGSVHQDDNDAMGIVEEEDDDDDDDDVAPLLLDKAERDRTRMHCHQSGPIRNRSQCAQRRLSVACLLCLFFIIGEVVGGYMSNSLAIITDAAHMFSDFASFCISLFAIWIGGRPAKKSFNYGLSRAEALGALFTVILIWYVSGILLYMAVGRLISNDFELHSDYMMIVAGCAVAFNIVLALLLHDSSSPLHGHGHAHGHAHANHQQLNVRAALIHVLGDLIQSVGVLISSIIIKLSPESKRADPVCTVIFSVIVFCTTLPVFRDTVKILLEGFPDGYRYDDIRSDLLSLRHVVGVHDLRIWSLTTDKLAMTVHLVVPGSCSSARTVERLLQKSIQLMRCKYGIAITTIQIEMDNPDVTKDCALCHLELP